MSPSHTYTVGVGANPLSADDEDLDDICPVCDGECTCANRPKPRPTLPSNGNGNALPTAITNGSSSLVPTVPTLKIKLTAGMLSKARAAQALSNTKKSKHSEETTYEIANDGTPSSISTSDHPNLSSGSASVTSGGGLQAPKRRGRPPKISRDPAQSASADHLLTSGNEANTLPSGSLSHPSRLHKLKDINPRAKPKAKARVAKAKGKGTTATKGKAAAVAPTNKKKTTPLSEDDLGSELTDLDDQGIEDDYDGQSVQYPTFVSASALSTSTFSEDSDTASSSGFGSESSMEAEEENYILSEDRRHEKARLRRELLGEDGHRRKDPHNDWVIRPRKQSVGASDVDMDVDSDATEDEDEEEEEEGEDGGDEDELDESNPGVTYAGVATGWSDEDEESSFDADLFFANLSDSTADGQSTCSEEEGDQSDWDADMTGPTIHAARLQMDNLPFEISQGWDGQIVFTNGLGEGQGILDLDFEVSAAQLVEDSASPSQDSDIEMQTTQGEDDGEYEEMGEIGEEEQSDDGDTTDDDYVDKNGLPTKRMLELFRWPSSLSAIDPMSTVSPIASPRPRNRGRNQRSLDSMSPRHSPRPADILAGKAFWDDSDEHYRGDVAEGSAVSSPRGAPVMGKFEAGHDHPRRAILNGSNKEIPSPFPRLKHRKKASSLSSSLDQFRGRTRSRPHSLSVSSSSALQGLSSEEQPSQASLDHPPAEAIDLHDVLDVSFLDAEAADPSTLSSTSASEGEASRRHLHSMNRWDHIPMGTFRRTRESGAIISDSASTSWQAETPRVLPADGFAQGSSRMLKSSPFSEITWHGRGSNPPKGTRRPSKASKNIVISPVILPVRDGDRTPTDVPPHIPPHIQRDHTQRKTRKELRRETKMKRKGYGPVHHQHQHHQRQHFQHNHHPNSKSRSTSSMQRTNFFNSPTGTVPPLNL